MPERTFTLAGARTNAGFTQQQAAKELKVSTATICNWENGKAYPNVKHVNALCKLYGRKYDEIDFLPNYPL